MLKPTKNMSLSPFTLLLIILAVAIVAIFIGYYLQIYMKPSSDLSQKNPSDLQNTSGEKNDAQISTRYTGSFFDGNYVYAAAMNLAWNEMVANVIHDKIAFKTDDPQTLALTSIFNSAPFSTNDLDARSYYVKSGFSQKTVDLINKEVKAKFPKKSFADLDLQLTNSDMISYAYFLKEVQYLTPFTSLSTFFMGQPVEGFMKDTGNEEQQKNVEVLDYKDDDQFILSLQLKDAADQLFVAKGFEKSTPEQVVDEINRVASKKGKIMDSQDNFQMPKISFRDARIYSEMIGKGFANKGFENYYLGGMYENIAFDIDEKGARVENEAVMFLHQSSAPFKVRNFLLNKPFWIVMKRHDSQNPYFIFQVNNTAFMKKVQN